MATLDPHFKPTKYLTESVPGIGGVLKERDEDFIVEELPAYEPCGEGEHLYLFVQKRHMATMHAVRLIAEHFGVKRDAVGFAGLKDKVGITTQLISVHLPGKKDEDFSNFEHPNLGVLWKDRHTNKLRRGHLAGNRFVIRVRKTSASKVIHAHRSLAMLAAMGVPNRIGVQRFGMLRNNQDVGRALLLGDAKGALDALLLPHPEFPEIQPEARRLYAEGKYDEAMRAMTGGSHTERRVLAALARGANERQAIGAIERMDYSFYITAFQSAVFNAILEERIASGRLATLEDGDLAFKHDSGAVFPVGPEMSVEERGVLPERLRTMEVSPSGPMWGQRMTRASGAIGEREEAALEEAGLSVARLEALSRRDVEAMEGKRRPMRVPVRLPDVEGGVDEHGEYVKCVFELPRGSFATTVMQEVMKGEVGEEEEE